MWLCPVGDFSPQESWGTETGTEPAESQRGGSRGAEPSCPQGQGCSGHSAPTKGGRALRVQLSRASVQFLGDCRDRTSAVRVLNATERVLAHLQGWQGASHRTTSLAACCVRSTNPRLFVQTEGSLRSFLPSAVLAFYILEKAAGERRWEDNLEQITQCSGELFTRSHSAAAQPRSSVL